MSEAGSVLMIVESISLDAFVLDGDLDDGVVLGIETAVGIVEKSLPNEFVLELSGADVPFVLIAIGAAIGLCGRGEVMIAVDAVVGDVVDVVCAVESATRLFKVRVANNLEQRDFAMVQAEGLGELNEMDVVCVDVEF